MEIMEQPLNGKEKILLVLPPYWETLIPPMGISCLKGFLNQYGYQVKTVDVNMVKEFKVLNDRYFSRFSEFIPERKRGNFYNIGRDVFRHHLMAHLNRVNENSYRELVKSVIHKTFFCQVDDGQLELLNQVVLDFFDQLKLYFLQLLEKEKPAVLGLSLYRGTIPAALFAARLTRETYPHILTVIGGGAFADQLAVGSANLELFMEKTKNYIDKIIVGEGELLFLKLLRRELPEHQRLYTIADIGNQTLDLGSTGVPDFTDFEYEAYPNLANYGSRSCPFQCTFCSETIQWGRYRRKDMKQLVDEMTFMQQKYSYQLFLMSDSLLNPIIEDFSEELIRRDTSIYWDGYLRADKHCGNIDNTVQWRKAGFYRARLGVESGSQKVLNLMDKKITVEQIRNAVVALAHAGIKTTTYWLVGYPGETEEDFQMTLDLIEELKDDIYEAWANVFWYYPCGQINSQELRKNSELLYPETAKEMLILETRIIKGEPTRQQMQERMFRFLAHCANLGVPNLYALHDYTEADDRWKKLHKTAVPPLIDFMGREIFIDENKKVKKMDFARSTLQEEMDFCF